MGFAIRAALLLCLLASSPALAGEIFVKDEKLEGKVAGFHKDGLEFETEYGKGNILVSWADLQDVNSDREMVLLYGDQGLVDGYLLAVDGDHILFGRDLANAARVPIALIMRGYDKADFDASTLERLRARWRYWSASLALSGSLTEASTNSRNLQIDLNVARKKAPTRYFLDATYQFADSVDEIGNNEKDQIAKRFFTQLRGERDMKLLNRSFILGSQSYEHDDVNDVKARLITRGGAGYRVVERKWGFVSYEVAPSFVYESQKASCDTSNPGGNCPTNNIPPLDSERGRGSKTNSFVALSMGSGAEVALPYGSKLTLRLDYFPDVVNWSGYLLQAKSVFSVPILDWLSFRLSLDNLLNSDPADDARRNRFTGTVGLSLDF